VAWSTVASAVVPCPCLTAGVAVGVGAGVVAGVVAGPVAGASLAACRTEAVGAVLACPLPDERSHPADEATAAAPMTATVTLVRDIAMRRNTTLIHLPPTIDYTQ
jgi:hypothetical protein